MVSETPKQATFWGKNLQMNTSEFMVVFNSLQAMKAKFQEPVVASLLSLSGDLQDKVVECISRLMTTNWTLFGFSV